MDNKEIKEMFDKLQVYIEKNLEESKKEHKEIREGIKNLCDRMTNTENTIDNHLINSEKKAKSKKEKASYLIAGVGMAIAAVSLYVNF